MKVLLTGAGGFLGKNVARMLLADGHKLRVLSRRELPELALAGAEVLICDLSDLDGLRTVARGAEAVVHCAGRSGLWGPLSQYIESNAMGTANILETARQAGVKYFVYTSSPSVVHSGGDLSGVDERAPYSLDTSQAYAYSKMLAERLVLAANGPSFKTLALRPHLIWGPGDPHLLPALLDRARRKKLSLFKGGPYLVDATYIDNAARAHILALEKLASNGDSVGGQAFFISQGQPMDVAELINKLLEAAGGPQIVPKVWKWAGRSAAYFLEWLYKALNSSQEPFITVFAFRQLTTSHWFNLDKARTLLGYEPSVTMEEGLNRLREFWQGAGGDKISGHTYSG
jgi:nucleoside-diphosphate-sugar epimerase